MTKAESQRRKKQNALSFSKLYQLGSTGHLYIIGKRKPFHQERGELQRSFLLPPFKLQKLKNKRLKTKKSSDKL